MPKKTKPTCRKNQSQHAEKNKANMPKKIKPTCRKILLFVRKMVIIRDIKGGRWLNEEKV